MILKRTSIAVALALLILGTAAALAVVALATLITLGYGVWTVRACRSDKQQPLDVEGPA